MGQQGELIFRVWELRVIFTFRPLGKLTNQWNIVVIKPEISDNFSIEGSCSLNKKKNIVISFIVLTLKLVNFHINILYRKRLDYPWPHLPHHFGVWLSFMATEKWAELGILFFTLLNIQTAIAAINQWNLTKTERCNWQDIAEYWYFLANMCKTGNSFTDRKDNDINRN